MLSPTDLVAAFARNASVIEMQADGLTHEDSLIQPPVRGNCLNWVVGHIVVHRDKILELLGAAPVMGVASERYDQDSEPITEMEAGVVSLAELLALLGQAQAQIDVALGQVDEATLECEIVRNNRPSTLGARLFFLYFHETYHVGQTELLRQLAGKNDAII